MCEDSVPDWVQNLVDEELRDGKTSLVVNAKDGQDNIISPAVIRFVINRLLTGDHSQAVDELGFVSCKLTSLPAEIGDLSRMASLLTLSCSDTNTLTSLPAEIGTLTALQKLLCFQNKLVSLPAEVGYLTALQELWCAGNKLTSLPAEIGNLVALRVLDCRNNELLSLPAEIRNLKALEKLDCQNNLLTSLPAEIGHLTALWSLSCKENNLVSLPSEIANLKSLRWLYCSGNRLASLPREIGRLTSLEVLDLSYGELSSLPAEIGNLSALQMLSCNNNYLTSLPAEIRHLASLQKLFCHGNSQLTSLSTEVWGLTTLQMLDCSGNGLISLPSEIGNLSALRTLICSNNMLTSLPSEIGELTALQTLDCSRNMLFSLPAGIGNLLEIEIITCRHNMSPRLVLPRQLFTLQCDLNFSSSKVFSAASKKQGKHQQNDSSQNADVLIPIPNSQCGYGATVASLRKYVDEFESATFVRPKNVRLMIVGDACAGKTTLVKAFVGRMDAAGLESQPFDSAAAVDNRRVTTFGLDVQEWTNTDDAVRLSVWDFAGQPEYHPVHQLFLASDALYVLAFDACAAVNGGNATPTNAVQSSSADDAVPLARRNEMQLLLSGMAAAVIGYLEAWTAMLSARAPGARVIIVGTHADKLTSAQDQVALRLLRSKINDFIARLQLGDGRAALARVVIDQPCMFVDALHADPACNAVADLCISLGTDIIQRRDLIPQLLLDMGKELGEIGKKSPAMSISAINDFALEKIGVHLERLPLTLREWGWVEYFADHPTLDQVVFINPQWLAKMMACVATKLGRSLDGRGTVGVSTLRDVWRDSGYVCNEELLDHLVNVMLAFDLAHRLDPETLVIPSLLQPANDAKVLDSRKGHRAELMLDEQQQAGGSDALRPVYTLSLFPSGLLSQLFVRLYTVPGIDDVLGWQGGFVAMLPLRAAGAVLDGGSRDAPNKQTLTSMGALRVEVVSANHLLEVAASSASAITVFEEALLSLCAEFFGGRIAVYRNGGAIQFADDNLHGYAKGTRDLNAMAANSDAETLPAAPASATLLAAHWLHGRCAKVDTPPLITFDASCDIEIGTRLGKGSFGEVFKCQGTGKNPDLWLGATFALKKRQFNKLGQTFNTEFGIMRRLAACRFTVGALGAQFAGTSSTSVTHVLMPVFEMALDAYVNKRYKKLGRKRWFKPDGEVVEWLMQVSQALRFMHELGLAHLDIKPENVLVRFRLEAGDSIKLLALADFGNTIDAGSVYSPAGTLAGACGTPGFIAPELFNATSDRPCVDVFAADIFSFGALASFVVSGIGILPVGSTNEQRQRSIPSDASAVRPPVCKGQKEWNLLRGLVAACISVDPGCRPSAAHMVASRLVVGDPVSVDVQACEQREKFLNRPLRPNSASWLESGAVDKIAEDLNAAAILAEVQEALAEAKRHAKAEWQRAEAAEKRAVAAEKDCADAERRATAEKQRADAAETRADAAKKDCADAERRAAAEKQRADSAEKNASHC